MAEDTPIRDASIRSPCAVYRRWRRGNDVKYPFQRLDSSAELTLQA